MPIPAPKTQDELKRVVISAVQRDSEAFRRIHSWLQKVLPDSWGVTGSVRNYGFALVNTFSGGKYDDPSDAQIEALVCTGIATATVNAINKAQIQNVMATTINRFKPIDHTATLVIWMPPLAPNATTPPKPQEFVFDWHHTLNPSNPKVMPKSSWLAGG